MHGFDVTAAGTVPEALAQINAQQFEVLIADLNIGQPGDGFTVVSAMRRTQPDAVTIIMTGFPAFETALQAIRSQVDDYIVKPASIEQLLSLIRGKLKENSPKHHHVSFKHVREVILENRDQIVENWLQSAKRDPLLGSMAISDEERKDHLPRVIEELVISVERGGELTAEARRTAENYGRTRFELGFDLPMMLAEASLLRKHTCEFVRRNLLALDISYVISELIEICDKLDQQLSIAVETFLAEERVRQAS